MSQQLAVSTSSKISLTGVTTDAAIGIDKTFTPDGIDSAGVARWTDQSQSVLIGRPSLSLSVRKPTSGSRMYKVTMKLVLPTLDISSPSTGTGIQPAPSKAYDTTAVLEVMLPERGVFADRDLIYTTLQSLFYSTINASDGTPTDATNSPLRRAIAFLEPVW